MELAINKKVTKYVNKHNWNLDDFFTRITTTNNAMPSGWKNVQKPFCMAHVPGSSDDEFYASINGNSMLIRAIYAHGDKGKVWKAGEKLAL